MKVIVIKENIFQSWAKDFVSVAALCFMFYANYRWCGASVVLNLTASICWFSTIISIVTRKALTVPEAIAALQSMGKPKGVENE